MMRADWLEALIQEASYALIQPSSGSANISVLSFLESRGVNAQSLKDYKIGWALPGCVSIDKAPDQFKFWSQQFLWNNLVFPLYSLRGEPIGLQTRTLDKTKDRSYQQYYLYSQSIYPYMFGMPQAGPHIFITSRAIIVEGVFDFFAVRSTGATNVVAILTAGAPSASKRFFRRFCKSLTVMTDMDKAGREAALHLQRELYPDILVSVPEYSEKDPGELYLKGKHKELAVISGELPVVHV